MVADFLGDTVPDLKRVIKETCVDTEDEEEIVSAKLPVGYSIMAAHQFRWMVHQVLLFLSATFIAKLNVGMLFLLP